MDQERTQQAIKHIDDTFELFPQLRKEVRKKIFSDGLAAAFDFFFLAPFILLIVLLPSIFLTVFMESGIYWNISIFILNGLIALWLWWYIVGLFSYTSKIPDTPMARTVREKIIDVDNLFNDYRTESGQEIDWSYSNPFEEISLKHLTKILNATKDELRK